MRRTIPPDAYSILAACGVVLLAACSATPDYGRPLPVGAAALLPLAPDEPHPDLRGAWIERDAVLPALELSLGWTKTNHARGFFPIAGIDHETALTSLTRFKELLGSSASASEFHNAVRREFQVYKSAGWDGQGGGVLFTGYCTPILEGSQEPREGYAYALYALPEDLVKASDGTTLGRLSDGGLEPYPARAQIESGALLEGQGLELAWLRDPIDAYIAHVNGSAFVRLRDGSELRLGYAGKNGRQYTSLGKQLVADGKLREDEVNLSSIRAWARAHPEQVQDYLNRNDSFVFFTQIEGNPRGSLNVEVSAERSLATDKTLFPRGAIVFVDTELQVPGGHNVSFEQVMFDQDTGGAIRTAGRADIYLGAGTEAEHRAGVTRAEGQLYYLFLKPGTRRERAGSDPAE